jgi:transcriptional regulator with GAF, ATPase, and Fis domain
MSNPHPVQIIAVSEAMKSILASIDIMRDSDSSVLLLGETGVGKEVVGDYVHYSSKRGEKALVKVGLAALPAELMESELFGHERGAFTGAGSEKRGLFELANGGSIMLDDIDDLPLPLQSKLLRVLESREVKRVGGIHTTPIDVRVITTSKVDLRELVDRGLFRADLFYRINVVPIRIPPLRHRREDIRPLIEHFLRRYAPAKNLRVTRDADLSLHNYSWPGNVRELRNVVQRIAVFAKDEITQDSLPHEITGDSPLQLLLKSCGKCFDGEMSSLDHMVTCLEKNLIRHALQESAGNKTEAARRLQIKPSTLRDKIHKHGLDSTT